MIPLVLQRSRVIGKAMRTCLPPLIAGAFCGLFLCSASAQEEPAGPQATVPHSLAERSRLTGDWGGARSRMEAAGLKLDLEWTMFYQGLVSGSGPKTFGLDH